MIRQIAVATLTVYLVSTMLAFAGTFRDDFENEQDFLKDIEAGTWEGEDGFVWEDGAIKGSAMVKNEYFELLTGDNDWSDYTVMCRIKSLRNQEWIGLMLRRPCINCIRSYVFMLDGGWDVAGRAAIYRMTGAKLLDGSPFTLEMDRWYSLKAVAQGQHLEFYIDDILVAEAEDAAEPAGKAGFGFSNSDVLFDDFVMTGPEVEDGGHWDPGAHPEPVQSTGKLATKWGYIKSD